MDRQRNSGLLVRIDPTSLYVGGMTNGRSPHVLSTSVLLLASLASSGCDKESSELTTKDIEADFTIEFYDVDPAKPATTIAAKLRESDSSAVGPQGSVNLVGGDALSVTTDKNDNLPMARTGDGEYSASLPNLNASVFTFHLKRAMASSDGTVFTMPGPLAFTDSPNGKSFGAGDTIHLVWTNVSPSTFGSSNKVYVSGSHYPCGGVSVTLAQKEETEFDDTGSLDISVSKLYQGAAPASGDCVDVEIRRRVTAEADAAFDRASSVTGIRTDRLKIKIN
jgi:hypothetical protein